MQQLAEECLFNVLGFIALSEQKAVLPRVSRRWAKSIKVLDQRRTLLTLPVHDANENETSSSPEVDVCSLQRWLMACPNIKTLEIHREFQMNVSHVDIILRFRKLKQLTWQSEFDFEPAKQHRDLFRKMADGIFNGEWSYLDTLAVCASNNSLSLYWRGIASRGLSDLVRVLGRRLRVLHVSRFYDGVDISCALDIFSACSALRCLRLDVHLPSGWQSQETRSRLNDGISRLLSQCAHLEQLDLTFIWTSSMLNSQAHQCFGWDKTTIAVLNAHPSLQRVTVRGRPWAWFVKRIWDMERKSTLQATLASDTHAELVRDLLMTCAPQWQLCSCEIEAPSWNRLRHLEHAFDSLSALSLDIAASENDHLDDGDPSDPTDPTHPGLVSFHEALARWAPFSRRLPKLQELHLKSVEAFEAIDWLPHLEHLSFVSLVVNTADTLAIAIRSTTQIAHVHVIFNHRLEVTATRVGFVLEALDDMCSLENGSSRRHRIQLTFASFVKCIAQFHANATSPSLARWSVRIEPFVGLAESGTMHVRELVRELTARGMDAHVALLDENSRRRHSDRMYRALGNL